MVLKIKVITNHKGREDFEINISVIGQNGCQTDEISIPIKSSKADMMETEAVVSGTEDFDSEVSTIQLKINGDSQDRKAVEVITVESQRQDEKDVTFPFPIRRQLKCDTKYAFQVYDIVLPQSDPYLDQRKQELAEERMKYEFQEAFENGPLLVKCLPQEEEDDDEGRKNGITETVSSNLFKIGFSDLISGKAKKLNDYKSILRFFPLPENTKACGNDAWFGRQRLQGINPDLLQLCSEIPEKFDIKAEEIEQFLEGKSLCEAVANDKIYIADLEKLDDIPSVNSNVGAPMALFYLNNNLNLLPIAIQLHQQPGPENPVFMPSDPEFTWRAAQCYYNTAEGIYHETITHLTHIHICMDVICVTTRRLLSKSHPIYKLLQPHFWRLLANNHYGIQTLTRKGGVFDMFISGTSEACKALISKFCAKPIPFRSFHPLKDFEYRGVLDSEALRCYPYRDDGKLIYEAIETYARKVVNHYYGRVYNMKNDSELKEWRLQLGRSQSLGGCGFTGFPGSDETGFENNEEIVQTCAAIIYNSSVKHAVVNYPQYDTYVYPPNHSLLMKKSPPTTKTPMTEQELVDLLPDKSMVLKSILILLILSRVQGKPLGYFERDYLYHPEDVKAVEEFREDLQKAYDVIKKRNEERAVPYPWMTGDYLRNSPNI